MQTSFYFFRCLADQQFHLFFRRQYFCCLDCLCLFFFCCLCGVKLLAQHAENVMNCGLVRIEHFPINSLFLLNQPNKLQNQHFGLRMVTFRHQHFPDESLFQSQPILHRNRITFLQTQSVQLLRPLTQSLLAGVAQNERSQEGSLDLIVPLDSELEGRVLGVHKLEQAGDLSVGLDRQVLVQVVAAAFQLGLLN